MVNILFSVDEGGYEGLVATINSIISKKENPIAILYKKNLDVKS